MLTAEQIRLRLERLSAQSGACDGCLELIAVLHAILPDLVALATQPAPQESQRSTKPEGWCYLCRSWFEDGLDHFESADHKRRHADPPWELCPNCTPEQPCDRARGLIGG